MQQYIILVAFLLCRNIFSSYVGESCDSGKGTCIDVNVDQCLDGTGIVKTGYCAGPSNIRCCEPPVKLPDRCYAAGGPPLMPNSYEFTLENQGFSGHPGAIVYVPSNFHNPKLQGLELVVYIHGYYNCIRNILVPVEEACNCTANNDIRDAYNLINQFEYGVTHLAESKESGYKKLLIAAEVAYDQANDSPGRWAEQNLFRAFIDELFTKHLNSILKHQYTLADIKRIRIVSHSGGYYTIGDMATVGGMSDVVYELTLLDSLYTNFAQFDAFVTNHLASFGTADKTQFRFSSLFTTDGGTYNHNLDMEERAKGWVASANRTEVLGIDNTLTDLTSDQLLQYSLLFKLSNLTHDNIPRYNFQQFVMYEL
jgi:hypothetical protein